MAKKTFTLEEVQALLAQVQGQAQTVAPMTVPQYPTQAPPVASPSFMPYMQRAAVPNFGPPPPGFGWTKTGRLVVDEFPPQGAALSCPNVVINPQTGQQTKCGGQCEYRENGRFGPFFGCRNRCGFIANLRGNAKAIAEASRNATRKAPEPIGRQCTCGGQLQIRQARRGGEFIGCSNYPQCDHTEPVSRAALGVATIPAGLTVTNSPVPTGNVAKSKRTRKSA